MEEIVAPSNVFPPPTHAALSVRSRCVFIANPLAAHSLQSIDAEAPRVPFTGHVDCLRLSADERNIAVASNDLIKLIDLTKGREIRNLSGHSLAVKALTPRRSSVYSWLSPDDTVLAVGTDSNLQLYDIRKRCSLKQFPSSTYGATYHPSQRLVATFGADRVVRFWCLDELVPVAMSDAFSAPIRCAQFACPSPDMEPVLVACTDHYMKTLTCEPCESLAINQIGDLRKVRRDSLDGRMWRSGSRSAFLWIHFQANP
ncbi:unnamed protein product [Heligmosomoides polygyrus]|uniref:WD_REPEATS_REGION domain-containing protein n=1 Tax=Heligmosomoides polygyrus TaxID=6339 RepID=A0A183FG25_HELPZ|nr:unnamed protein product [Heligmosomoides polygyrus]